MDRMQDMAIDGRFNHYAAETNLTNTKRCKKNEKGLKPWHMGTHLRAFSESFPMNTNMTGFR